MSEVLFSKLLPPRVETGIIDRPRLLELLSGLEKRKATLLVAPAGYGKTVLMRQVAEAADRTLIWYQLDEYDNDPTVFLQYLLAGIERHFPGFGQQVLPIIQQGNIDIRLRLLVTIILNGLVQQATKPILLALDDYHLITEMTIHRFLQEFLEHLPDQIHVIIAGRTVPPLSVPRFKVTGTALTIGSEDLRFTSDEINSFLTRKSIPASKETIEFIEKRSDGWPAILKLAVRSASVPDLIDAETKEIYDYLAAEVLEQQPPPVQSFLLASSALETMTAAHCDQLLERNDSQQMLDFLDRQQLFLVPLAGKKPSYRYHQLFREFLLDRLGSERLPLLRRCAELAWGSGELDRAVELLIAGGYSEKSLELIKEASEQALQRGRWQTVRRWLEPISEVNMAANPWLSLFRARIEAYQGRLTEAEQWAGKAAELFQTTQNRAGLVESWLIQARIIRSRGKHRESLALMEQAEAMLPPEETKLRLDLVLEKFIILGEDGYLNEAEVLLSETLTVARQANNGYLVAHLLEALGHIYFQQGKYAKALQCYREGAAASPDQILPGYYMQDYVAIIYRDWGDLDRAFEYIQRSVALKEKYGLNEALPTAYLQLAAIYTDRGELRLGEEYYCRALDLLREEKGDRLFTKLVLAYFSRCLGLQGRWLEARARAEEALSGAVQPLILPAVRQVITAMVFARTGSIREGGRMLQEAIDILERIGVKSYLCYAYVDLAWYYLTVGEPSAALEAITKSLKLAAEHNFMIHFITYFDWLYPVLRLALEHNLEVTFVQRILTRLGERSLNILLEMAAHPDREVRLRTILPLVEIGGEQAQAALWKLKADSDLELRQAVILATERLNIGVSGAEPVTDGSSLKFQILGPLRIMLNGAEVTPINWRTGKARDLLAYLLHRGEPVTRETILEELWPDADPEKAANHFHTIIYFLRRILGKAGLPDLVIYHNQCYQLGPVKNPDTDRRLFQTLVAAGLHQKTLSEGVCNYLERAVAIYRGDYLKDLDYTWLISTREYLKSLYHDARLRLAHYYLERRNYHQAISHLYSLVELNPLSEEIYRLLMTAHAALGKQQVVQEQYQSLSALLQKELGLTPSPETQELYYKLSGQSKSKR